MKTQQFSQNQGNKSNSKSNKWKAAGAAIAGGAIGSFATAMTQNDEDVSAAHSTQDTTPSEHEVESPKASDVHPNDNANSETPSKVSEHVSGVNVDEPQESPSSGASEHHNSSSTSPSSAPQANETAEPVEPVVEIDPNDIDLPDFVEDITDIQIVSNVNDEQMVVATAHNSTDGDFYLVDADMDGDFDVVLDSNGNPVAELTGNQDQFITVAEVQAKVDNGYIPPTEVDNLIADNNMQGEDINQDITIVDDNDIA